MANVLLIGCAQDIKVGPADELWSISGDQQRVWPAAPSAPRIRYLRSVNSAADLGFRAPALEQFFEFMVGIADRGLARPYGIAVEGRLLLIADPGAAAIHFLDLNGKFYKRVSTVGTTDLLSPVGVVIGAGNIFVSDSALNKIFILDLQGNFVGEIDGLERPTGLAFDAVNELLYVAETLAHRIAVYSLDGTRLLDIDSPADGDKAFNAATHIAFRDGVLLINGYDEFPWSWVWVGTGITCGPSGPMAPDPGISRS